MTQKEIKSYVSAGLAKDISSYNLEIIAELQKNGFSVIGTSSGVYGLNGGLFQDNVTGERFAIIGRTSNLFRLL